MFDAFRELPSCFQIVPVFNISLTAEDNGAVTEFGYEYVYVMLFRDVRIVMVDGIEHFLGIFYILVVTDTDKEVDSAERKGGAVLHVIRRKSAVRNGNRAVIQRDDRRIHDADCFDGTFSCRTDDVVSDLERMSEKDQDTSRKMRKTVAQRKTDGDR